MYNFLKSKRFWQIFIITITFLFALSWIAVSTAIYFMAPKLTFDTEKSKNLSYDVNYTTIFKADKTGEKIEILSVPKSNFEQKDIPVIVYFHGNIGRRPYIIRDASKYGRVISPAYPGYSNSEGESSSDKVYETADVTMQYLLDSGVPQNNIIVIGHSLGGSPAMYAAEKYPNLKKVIIINTFFSMEAMCQTRYSIFCSFGNGFLNTAKIAPLTKAKIRMFCNSTDDYLPPKQCIDLYQKVGSDDKKLFNISGTHDKFSLEAVLTTE
jgi:pimeloyl-ACP methyl ester carboxylesterase